MGGTSEKHVHTVECEECHRPFTAFFYDPLPDYALCADCEKARAEEKRGKK
jgi:hypothetical protein